MTDFTSRTARIPPRNRKRKLTISSHAVERFRESVDEEFRHRDDEDLANLLDERLSYAEHSYEVRDPRAPEEITTLRTVACRHVTLYAVVRNDTVVTVLDEHMAKNNFDGQWKPLLNTPFAGLKDLKLPPPSPKLLPAGVVTALTSAASPAPEPPPPPDPLADAGRDYALARRKKTACVEAVSRARGAGARVRRSRARDRGAGGCRASNRGNPPTTSRTRKETNCAEEDP